MIPTGRVFDVSQGCIDDGPGLRTVVFLQGCGLRCPWCHNPEGLSQSSVIAFDAARCIDCGACAEACPSALPRRNDDWRARCQACGRCADACPSGARRLVGRRVSVCELVDELLQDRDSFEVTGGGVTFSGGEPLLQSAFVFACAAALEHEGIHVAVETAGAWPDRLVPGLVNAARLVLFDLKHVDAKRWRGTVGGDSGRALSNLSTLLAEEIELELRITVVPGFNSSVEDAASIARFLARQPRRVPIRLQPMLALGAAKEDRFGRTPLPGGGASRWRAGASPTELRAVAGVLAQHDLEVVAD